MHAFEANLKAEEGQIVTVKTQKQSQMAKKARGCWQVLESEAVE